MQDFYKTKKLFFKTFYKKTLVLYSANFEIILQFFKKFMKFRKLVEFFKSLQCEFDLPPIAKIKFCT